MNNTSSKKGNLKRYLDLSGLWNTFICLFNPQEIHFFSSVPDKLPNVPTQIGKMAYGDVKVTHYMTLNDFMEFVGVSSLHVCILKMFCAIFILMEIFVLIVTLLKIITRSLV